MKSPPLPPRNEGSGQSDDEAPAAAPAGRTGGDLQGTSSVEFSERPTAGEAENEGRPGAKIASSNDQYEQRIRMKAEKEDTSRAHTRGIAEERINNFDHRVHEKLASSSGGEKHTHSRKNRNVHQAGVGPSLEERIQSKISSDIGRSSQTAESIDGSDELKEEPRSTLDRFEEHIQAQSMHDEEVVGSVANRTMTDSSEHKAKKHEQHLRQDRDVGSTLEERIQSKLSSNITDTSRQISKSTELEVGTESKENPRSTLDRFEEHIQARISDENIAHDEEMGNVTSCAPMKSSEHGDVKGHSRRKRDPGSALEERIQSKISSNITSTSCQSSKTSESITGSTETRENPRLTLDRFEKHIIKAHNSVEINSMHDEESGRVANDRVMAKSSEREMEKTALSKYRDVATKESKPEDSHEVVAEGGNSPKSPGISQQREDSAKAPPLTSKDQSVPILEARLVDDEPDLPIYDAVPVEDDGPRPWWKRYQKSIIVVLVSLVIGLIVAVALGAGAGTSSDQDEKTQSTAVDERSPSQPTQSPSTPTLNGTADILPTLNAKPNIAGVLCTVYHHPINNPDNILYGAPEGSYFSFDDLAFETVFGSSSIADDGSIFKANQIRGEETILCLGGF